MGKKRTQEVGLTDQLLLLEEMNQREAARQAKKSAKLEEKRLDKAIKKGIKRIDAAVKAASDRLVTENATGGGTLINVTGNPTLHFDNFEGPFEFDGVPKADAVPVAAWRHGVLALVPEHQSLAAMMAYTSVIGGYHDVWLFTEPSHLLCDFADTADNARAFITDQIVDPIVEWLDSLGQPETSAPSDQTEFNQEAFRYAGAAS